MRQSWHVLLVLLAASPIAFTQATADHGKTEKQFLLRVERVSERGHTIGDCYLLKPDGSYRREQWEEQPIAGKRSQTDHERFAGRIFEGQLSPDEVSSVREFVMAPEFEGLSEPAQLKMSSEFLTITVFRQSQKPQSLRLSAAGDYKKNEAALKPLFDWMKQMEKRKHDVSKAEADHCKLPARVEFRQPAPQP